MLDSTLASDEDEQNAIFSRLLLNAIDHMDTIDWRTATSLQASGRLSTSLNAIGRNTSSFFVTAKKDSMKRLRLLPGPFAFFEDANRTRRDVVSLVHSILSPVRNVRTAVASELEALVTMAPSVLTPKSKHAIKELAPLIKSDDLGWRVAAVRLADILNDDWLFDIAALKQSLQTSFPEGARIALEKIVRPTISSIDSINLTWWDPKSQRTAIRQRIAEIADASKLARCLTSYYTEFGHLPLASDLSMGEVVQLWSSRVAHTKTSIWNLVRDWYRDNPVPLAQYHARQIFLHNPQMLPFHARKTFWAGISSIVSWPFLDDSDERPNPWRVWSTAAIHFLRHLECLSPWNDGSRVASMAWWLSNQLAQAMAQRFPDMTGISKLFALELQRSNFTWQVARPAMRSSELRAVTALTRSPWASATLNQLGKIVRTRAVTSLREEPKNSIDVAMRLGAFQVFPQLDQSHAIYAFEAGFEDSIVAWRENVSPKLPDGVIAVLNTWKQGNLLETVKAIEAGDSGYQEIVAHLLQMSAYLQTVSLEEAFAFMIDPALRERIALVISDDALAGIFDAFAEIQSTAGGKWLTNLPHLYALACEAAKNNDERRRLLFMFTILSSIHTDSVSAVARVLGGEVDAGLKAEMSRWRENLRLLQRDAAPWIAARLGPMIACLNP